LRIPDGPAQCKGSIEFAQTGGLRYTHLDWKRYGTEDLSIGNATTVLVPNLDIPEKTGSSA